jgi:hypothetical protein
MEAGIDGKHHLVKGIYYPLGAKLLMNKTTSEKKA